jgi:hypothetical protein
MEIRQTETQPNWANMLHSVDFNLQFTCKQFSPSNENFIGNPSVNGENDEAKQTKNILS